MYPSSPSRLPAVGWARPFYRCFSSPLVLPCPLRQILVLASGLCSSRWTRRNPVTRSLPRLPFPPFFPSLSRTAHAKIRIKMNYPENSGTTTTALAPRSTASLSTSTWRTATATAAPTTPPSATSPPSVARTRVSFPSDLFVSCGVAESIVLRSSMGVLSCSVDGGRNCPLGFRSVSRSSL